MMLHGLCFLVLMVSTTHALYFTVTNNAGTSPGGAAFRDKVGIAYSRRTLISATRFTLRGVFQQKNLTDRKPVHKISLFVDDMDGVAYTSSNEIHLSARYVGNYTGDVKTEITGVLYHETVHVWQWNGNGQAPGGLIEGIADYVRLKANYTPSHWVKPGQGQKWNQGYDVTAYFLDYCDSLKSGFVAQLNNLMKTAYSDQFFVQILGKPVDQLWQDYKANYGNIA